MTRFVLLVAFWIACVSAGARLAAAPADLPLTPIGTLLDQAALARSPGDPVRIRGVVTWTVPERMALTVEDATGGMWVNCFHDRGIEDRWRALRGTVVVGTELTITGTVDPGGYAPLLRAASVEIASHGDAVPLQPADLGRLFAGVDNARRLELTGVVQQCSDGADRDAWTLTLACEARRLSVLLPRSIWAERPTHLVDAEIRVIGVAGADRNTRGEFLGPALLVARSEDVEILVSAPVDPFTAAFVPLERLGAFRSEPRSGHRIRTSGIVTFAAPSGFFVIQRELHGVRVALAAGPLPAVGDEVEAAGFLEMDRQVAGLTTALARVIGQRSTPPPSDIAPDRIAAINERSRANGAIASPSSYEGCLVRFRATVVESKPDAPGGRELVLSSGNSLVTARLEQPAAEGLPAIVPGTEIDATGVMQINFTLPRAPRPPSRDPVVDRMALLVRSADDIALIRRPSWWTTPRLAGALVVVLSGFGAAIAWAATLSRRVRQITAQLSAEMQSRRNAAVEFDAAIRERNRIAANLHDTLLQTLRGVDYQLGACRAYGEKPAADPWEHLEVARRMVNHAAEELRDSVWALRTVPMPGGTFAQSLEAIARRTAHGHAEHIAVRTVGDAFELPQFVAGNLLLVAQEAMHNALTHADCGQIEVTATFEPQRGAVDVAVADDGRGFAVDEAAGPNQGHFGLTGMRERIERLGGSFSITSQQGLGTTVRARVQKRAYDALIDVGDRSDAGPGTPGTASSRDAAPADI
jgi:signal transduction histidine kinase